MNLELQLLRDYQGQSCKGWLMSEKLDGWRVLWTGTEFITREGNRLDAPKWFRDSMPSCALDGELFAGRGEFNSIQRRLRDGWHGLTFQVFDAPEMVAPFRKRLAFLKTLSLPPHVDVVAQERCNGVDHLIDAADAVVAMGGEGIVVRDPRAVYCYGRTESVLRWVPQCPRLNRRKSA
jgi:DNA ligase-1